MRAPHPPPLPSATPALAQLGGALQAPTLPPIPKTPLLEHWLLEAPLVPALTLGLLAIALWLTLRPARPRSAWIAVAISAALAGAFVAIAGAVETDRERLAARTADLVDAVAEADADRADPLLHERASVRSYWFPRGWNRARTLDEIASASGARPALDRYQIRDTRAAVRPDGAGVTLVRVMVWTQDQNAPVGTWWRLDWTRDGDDRPWRAIAIEPLWIAGLGDVSARNR